MDEDEMASFLGNQRLNVHTTRQMMSTVLSGNRCDMQERPQLTVAVYSFRRRQMTERTTGMVASVVNTVIAVLMITILLACGARQNRGCSPRQEL